ncbi:tRNA uridine-5-carboxymethylaminomethyl(34) synthesis GTPase MnmE [Sulfurirhabdus autotrophica]|uniref:tRNA modification GTPase MnmE n=1 Tax=Sulfurirhabdus autotrophica TaxID=1706046 RepID=A0A4R3XXA4_9PROT|nr:tRNA uridine-5-carboxymethylaminomethyl(34) synthesis GTPase MnmE [Sulfurirhabdus autotrophica]TCV82233.1 tRNA modification GTPase trmE [Sulfurirhabdus autotrophica]
MLNADTIAAVATAPGRGGIGVVRVSGKSVSSIALHILGKVPEPRSATLSFFLDECVEPLDQGIALFFPGPNSFTGEDVLELQGHGGPAVLQLVLSRCLKLGARIAEPGEFTQRAYLNDKIDLAQAESVVDLIDAASAEAARSAMRSLKGEFSRLIYELVEAFINLRMLVEATLDFPEEDIDFLEAAGAGEKLNSIKNNISDVLKTARQGSILREGLQVVLIGQPNVGKSSLLNQLAGEEVAIVTSIAGTTRDAIRQQIKIEGVPIHIIDTAGLRETQDQVELIGIERTWHSINQANLAILVIDAAQGLAESDQKILDKLPASLPVVRVFNKIDLQQRVASAESEEQTTDIFLSAKTGEGVSLLHDFLLQTAGWQPSGEGVFMARERHLVALHTAMQHVEHADNCWHQLELLAEELRLAQASLNSITGEFSADDLLGEIFSRFCIGK